MVMVGEWARKNARFANAHRVFRGAGGLQECFKAKCGILQWVGDQRHLEGGGGGWDAHCWRYCLCQWKWASTKHPMWTASNASTTHLLP